ncbi:SapC family protein [Bradyrhizobium sp. KBS0727]|uniref:SapC family protein n=1 Tax=unclassified Bradyrhizobium TaxID=2631580 RepID=UPI00110DB3CB|nr:MULTISPECIES: SapC family protein [unclassified Bradyrhizobium]QDW36916.1 SapC family protein [Bradyrhizobium sp. KBS0725]QDW43516.1 SapC family protein [Bradyrhizobium sp. KBS0727]
MTTQLLIYETVVPVMFANHRHSSVDIGRNFAFSSKINSVPLTAIEFRDAQSDYPIVFAGNKEGVMPAVILGLREGENLYLSRDGKWDARYIPAFVRRYPFVFAKSEDGERFNLCIDEQFSGFNGDGRGERLFTDDGKPTTYVENILKFLQEYQLQFHRTERFCKKLLELDLLEPMHAQVEMNSGEKYSLGGFMAVNREKLKELSGEKLAELAKTDELELIYLHLQSMRNFAALKDRLGLASIGKTDSVPDSEEIATSGLDNPEEPKGRRHSPKSSNGSRARSAVLE